MNLTKLTGDQLDQSGIKAVRSERESTAVVLHHLMEVERRKHYSALKLDSLFAYAMKVYGYSEPEALRRISAMRLMRELPEIETKIESGALNLTHLNKAQSMFRREKNANRKRSSQSKLEILEKIQAMPVRQVEKVLEVETYSPVPKKRVEPISLEQFSESVRKKLERLLDIRSHVLKGRDLEGLIDQLADLGISKWDEVEKAKRIESRKRAQSAPTPPQVNCSASIDAGTRRAVFVRDQSKCTQCGSSRHLQIDHIHPRAKGGSNDLSNLRLLCRSCNLHHAIETYGVSTMTRYLKEPSRDYNFVGDEISLRPFWRPHLSHARSTLREDTLATVQERSPSVLH